VREQDKESQTDADENVDKIRQYCTLNGARRFVFRKVKVHVFNGPMF
jgi:hypothetical protein